jgi:hypothetical protein
MQKMLIKQKAFAAAVHFAASVLMVALAAALCALLWFPSPVFFADLREGFTLIVLVDLVLGPLMTLVVYNAAKASLKTDLAVIVVLQLAALMYGVSQVYSQRPVVQVLYFEGIAALRAMDVKIDSPLPVTNKLHGIPLYYLDLPASEADYQGLKLAYDMVGEAIASNVTLYKPIASLPADLKALYLPLKSQNVAAGCFKLDFEFRATKRERCFNLDALISSQPNPKTRH